MNANEIPFIIVLKIELTGISVVKGLPDPPRQMDIGRCYQNFLGGFHNIHDSMKRMRALLMVFLIVH